MNIYFDILICEKRWQPFVSPPVLFLKFCQLRNTKIWENWVWSQCSWKRSGDGCVLQLCWPVCRSSQPFMTALLVLQVPEGSHTFQSLQAAPPGRFLSFDSAQGGPAVLHLSPGESVLQRITDLQGINCDQVPLREHICTVFEDLESTLLIACIVNALSSLRKLHYICRIFMEHSLVVSKQ